MLYFLIHLNVTYITIYFKKIKQIYLKVEDKKKKKKKEKRKKRSLLSITQDI